MLAQEIIIHQYLNIRSIFTPWSRCLHEIRIFVLVRWGLTEFCWRRRSRRNSSFSCSAWGGRLDRCLVICRSDRWLWGRLLYEGWCEWSGVSEFHRFHYFEYVLWRRSKRKSFPWLWLKFWGWVWCQRLLLVPIERILRLVFWVQVKHLYVLSFTSIE